MGGGGAVDLSFITATADKILSDYIGIDKEGNKVNGSMPNNGTINQTLNAGDNYVIPEGYHNGTGKITANSLSSQTPANAAASDIISGKTAFVNGAKLTGSMINQGAWAATLPINGKVIIPAGYHNGSGYLNQSIPVQGAMILNPGESQKIGYVSGKYMTGNIIVPGISIPAINLRKNIQISFPDGSKSAIGTYLGDNMQENQNFWYIGQNYGVSFSNGAVSGDRWILNPTGLHIVTVQKDFVVSGWNRLRIGGNFSPGNTIFTLRLKINNTLVDVETFAWSVSQQWFNIDTIRKISAGSEIRISPNNGGLYLLHLHVENYG